MPPDSNIQLTQAALIRERNARKAAEKLLEQKSYELFQLSEALKIANSQLVEEVDLKSVALEEQERRYELLISSVQDVIFTASASGELLFVNPAIQSVLGYDIDEFVGSNITHFIPESHREGIVEFYLRQIEKASSSSYLEIPTTHKNGHLKWMGLKIELVNNPDSELQLLGVARDITTAREQQIELESLSAQLRSQAVLLKEINEYAVSVMDKHSMHDIVKEVTGRLISKLEFEDCIIYLKEGDVLKQVAAYGPKQSTRHNVIDPIEVPLGKGITGTVAVNGESLIIPDTAKDPRYIVDDRARSSEMAVPIIADGDVIGVIDSEHSQVNFFTAEHLSFVETIASLISAKIKETRIMELANDRIRRSEEKYRGIIENMQLGLMEVDINGVITKPYPSMCAMTGYSPEELTGQNANEIFLPSEMTEQMQAQDLARNEGESGVYEINMRHKDGHMIHVIISGAPFYDDAGNMVGSIGIHYDISQLKELQQELDEARQLAENARDAQKDFLANMSHEIRNPIHSIYGMGELLSTTELSTEQERYVTSIQSASDILRALVSDILDISKIDEGKMEVTASVFDLKALLENISDFAQTLVLDKDVHFLLHVDQDIPKWLSGDTTFLNQILMNLLTNAMKFTNEGSIELKTHLISTSPTHAEFEFIVRDTGQGIPEDKLDHIFSRFSQAGHASAAEKKGSGLGLSIVKNLVTLMDGSITVASQLGKGSIFTVRLPFEIITSHDIENVEVASSGRSLNILIVEDSEINRLYLQQSLTLLGHTGTTCENGLEGLNATKKDTFDLILLDIRMPVMNGYEMTQTLRNDEENRNRNIPIVALTASALKDEKDKALSVGMNHHLSKPFTKDQLQSVISICVPASAGYKSSGVGQKLELGEVIDQEMLLDLYGGDWQHALMMLEVFVKNADSTLTTFQQLLEAQDWDSIGKQLHKVKPGLMMIGLKERHADVVKLEDAVKSNHNISELHERVRAFIDNLAEDIPHLNSAISTLQSHLNS